ncbi:hypothetical protein NDA16_000788 [Ustilago loliicola]|nr:hypothetical protein NDA16_004598 [Ustilago loliicola]KAJ1026249.1 hypothetical protein NDA16_002336 [Ustilago loliicola]KAJ1027649.1 hypothetical protein NDA16_001988 [Ustilago loliicola]KAJ1032769.1 hypothetical protein NDA16_000788 [Ustilago loliicola]
MKTQISYTLFTAVLIGFAKAGWETPTATLSYDVFCGPSAQPPKDLGYVCFTTKTNALGFVAQSDFRGFLQPGNKNFVLYDGNPTTKNAVWENNNVHVTVMFSDKQRCAAVDVQDKSGKDLRNLNYCGQGSVSIDP